MKVTVLAWLKPGIADPVGEDLTKKAKVKGFPITNIATGKHFDLEVVAQSKEEANRIVTEACEKLLTNATIERFEIVETGGLDEKTSNVGQGL